MALEFMGQLYYYVYNLQGDVVGLVDKTGTTMVTYKYDVWGKPESTTGPMATTLGVANPFRYRGYYYDTESGFYYLQSRYYDPEVGRFLNADGYVSTGQGIPGYNMFAYCNNNPIMYSDSNGQNAVLAIVATAAKIMGGLIQFNNEIISNQQILEAAGFKDTSLENALDLTITVKRNNIKTKEQKAHFLSQCAYETNYGKWLTEIGGQEYFAKKAYGYKYRGAGYIQLTWDYNYRNFANYIGDEEIYNQGANYVAEHYAWQAAGWWWSNNKMNQRISNGATVADVTRRVKGSPAGWEDRDVIFQRMLGLL